MSWNYDPTLPNEIDIIRMLIGDTDPLDQQLSDESLQFFFDNTRNVYIAASQACYALAASLSRIVTMSVGGASIQYSQRYDHYIALASSILTQGAAILAPRVYAGGISVIDKWGNELDLDRPRPQFHEGLHRDGYNEETSGYEG